jgi:transketolase
MASTKEQLETAGRPSRRRLANAIRVLAMDAVQQAKSGHPGMPMGMADIAEVLWNDFLKFSPQHGDWPDRDRFILSNGHGSMLLYAVAHLAGYPLTIDELRAFRQFGSRTAGHPERELEIGIETTTGPLGQGIANAVGTALAEKLLAARFNRPGHAIVDHCTYAFLGDGCMMEGISHEACALAGALGLGKLIALYDDNGISIDGEIGPWMIDDTPARFRAYGWHVVDAVDGHDPAAIAAALAAARADTGRPSLICCKTIIGYGSPGKQGTAATHGAALGADEVAATRAALGWDEPPFVIPSDIRAGWDATDRGAALVSEWRQRFAAYAAEHPELAAEFERRIRGDLPDEWASEAAAAIAAIAAEAKDTATRSSSERALDAYAPLLPELMGGSADLTGSNNTFHAGSVVIDARNAAGNYIHYGVREFGMAAIMNGLALHGGLIPYGGTFLVFSDYARSAIRMAALIGVRSIFVLTHDSIGLGEDGPTHQPVEHLASLRAIPNLAVWRPCDAVETAVAWRAAIERRSAPTALVLSRQGLPHVDRTSDQIDCVARGGYILRDTGGAPQIVLIATGSELAPALRAASALEADGIAVRVVSMPCVEAFAGQDDSYRRHVLGSDLPRLVVEAGVDVGWWKYAGDRGRVIAMHGFGASAPATALFEHFGFTVEHIVATAREML